LSVHRTDRKTNPYVVRWRDDENRQRSKSFPTKRAAESFDRSMRQAQRKAHENQLLHGALAKLDAEMPDASPEQLRSGARMARAFANADWDEVTAADLRLMRLQNRLADELDRRANEIESRAGSES
jgi:hypothetical protein